MEELESNFFIYSVLLPYSDLSRKGKKWVLLNLDGSLVTRAA